MVCRERGRSELNGVKWNIRFQNFGYSRFFLPCDGVDESERKRERESMN